MMNKKKIFVLALLILSVECFSQNAAEITTLILVRHAEKSNDGTQDPELSSDGFERAKRLASALKNTAIDAVYSTDFKRTRNTVTPLATSKNLQLQTYDGLKPEFFNDLVKRHAGGTIVICGHSNTVPAIANLLIGKDEFKPFADSEYDNMLIISVENGKNAKVIRLNY